MTSNNKAIEAVAKDIYKTDCANAGPAQYATTWEALQDNWKTKYLNTAKSAIAACEAALWSDDMEAAPKKTDKTVMLLVSGHVVSPCVWFEGSWTHSTTGECADDFPNAVIEAWRYQPTPPKE